MDDEKKAQKVLEEIESFVSNGKGFRKYSSLDMIRFVKFVADTPDVLDLSPIEMLRSYDRFFPEKTASEKLENLNKFCSELFDCLPEDEA